MIYIIVKNNKSNNNKTKIIKVRTSSIYLSKYKNKMKIIIIQSFIHTNHFLILDYVSRTSVKYFR